MKNQAKVRYTDTAYVIHQQWLIGGVPATFPVVHQYLQKRLAEQKKEDQDLKCRCLKSEPLLSERKQRRRKSRSLERQRSRRSFNNTTPITPIGFDSVDSPLAAEDDTTTDEEDPRPLGSSAVVAEVYHRANSTIVPEDDETSSVKTLVNRKSCSSEVDSSKLNANSEDLNRNRLDVVDLNVPILPVKRATLPSPVVLRKQFFEPISESSTSCDDDDRSATTNSDYATVQFINQVSFDLIELVNILNIIATRDHNFYTLSKSILSIYSLLEEKNE